MNLAIDIGNTRIKAGVFNGAKLLGHCAIALGDIKKLEAFIKKHPGIDQAILSSTIDYPKGLKALLRKYKLVELSEKTPLPFKNAYKTPETLGKDRLAAVAGAQQILHKKNVLAINAGTCITYDFIDSKGVYHGGSISPGLQMRFKALHTFTGRLPLIQADTKFKGITGTNTKESILTGVQQGMVQEIEGFIKAYKSEHKNVQVMLTGGDAEWLKTTLQSKIIFEPFVTLKGLNVILALCLKSKNPKHN